MMNQKRGLTEEISSENKGYTSKITKFCTWDVYSVCL